MHIGQRHLQPGIFSVDRTALPVTHTIGEIQILQCHRFRRVDHKNTVRAVAGNVNICLAVAVHIAIDRQPDINGDLTFQRYRASLEAGIEGNGEIGFVEVLGEAGERLIKSEEIIVSDDRRFEKTVKYSIGSTPKVSYGIEVKDGAKVIFEPISP